jgi:hypothetical protein
LKRIALLFAFIIIACSHLSADTWTPFAYDGGNPLATGSPSQMSFTFGNNHLSLNSNSISTVGGSSAMTWNLLFSGNWAVCGTIDESGAYVPDLYASFETDGQGGYVRWANNTPDGHLTSLLVGMPFEGDGATAYTSRWGSPLGEVTASLALNTHPSLWGSNYNLYEPVSHSFNAAYSAVHPMAAVPEPSGLISLLAGGISLLGCGVRRNRR